MTYTKKEGPGGRINIRTTPSADLFIKDCQEDEGLDKQSAVIRLITLGDFLRRALMEGKPVIIDGKEVILL